MRVLLIEDSPRRVRALMAAGVIPVDARVASSARDGVQAVSDGPWDAVFLDFDLEGDGNGGDVAKALCGVPWRAARYHIHSTNTSGGLEMRNTLEGAGIEVTWVPITRMLPDQALD